MQYLDYFMSLGILFGGTCVNSLKTLPHVIKYQTITPQKLSQTSTEQQKNPQTVTYSLGIDGHNRTLHLERNVDLLGRHFSVVHYSAQGTEETTMPDYKDHCYYHGHIVEVEDSSASMELCSGIKGYVRIKDQSYLIEPLAEESEAEQQEGEGLHAVYNYQHLRRKRSSCAHDDKDTFFDHGSAPAGMFQLSKVKSSRQKKFQTGKTRTVEMVLVVDNTEYRKFVNRKDLEARMIEVVNHVDKLYRPVGLRVMLVALELWSGKDRMVVDPDPKVTLDRFLFYRQNMLLPRIKHDNAQFVTGVDFIGQTVGFAPTSTMCTDKSGAVNQDHNDNAIGVATTMAHEMGHNLNLSHDDGKCVCRSHVGCIMAASHRNVYSEEFSSCSLEQLATFLEEVNPACLLDTPSTGRVFGGPVCGNAFLEPGEECDCGTAEECNNQCCNTTTCKFNAGAKCADGECCSNCKLRQIDTLCRASAGDCDLAEYCTGISASCPVDDYTQNGLPCNRMSGYCFNGQCPSRAQHCRRLWGTDAKEASETCYQYKDACGTLFCSGGKKFPVTSGKKYFFTATNDMCNEATTEPQNNYPPDIGMIPTGTKCGSNMVCYQQRCQHMKGLERVYGAEDCSDKCNNRGVCNHERQCHCDPGWAAPYCDVKLSEVSTGMNNAVVIGISLTTVLILLSVATIGGLLWCRKRRGSTKRPRHTSTGESNPVFESASVQGSPRLWPPQIGKPKFVESTASQVLCKPATPKPPTRRILPSRAALQPPMKMAVVPQPPAMQQIVRPSTTIQNQGINLKTKPPPPARPLPPLQSKTVTKPKPPVPPAKPSGSPSPWKHNQLPAARAALKPPTQQR